MNSPMFPRRARFAAALAAALALALSVTLVASANLSLVQLSSDPFSGSAGQHKTQVEPDTFAYGSTFVSAFQVGRFFGGGASDIGFSTSTNGAHSFTAGFLPGTTPYSTPTGIYARVSDPSVAYDARHGVWLISYLGLFPNGTPAVDVLVSRSTDGGLTWSNPVTVNTDGDFNDKNWTACDNTPSSPFYGNCYTEFDDNTHRDLILMSTSTDGGLTWSAGQPTQNHDHGIGGQPVVQPNGTVVVPIVGFGGNKALILSFVSTDGGASWGKTTQVTTISFHAPAGGIRADIPLPSAEIDAAGKVYVVWSDCRFEPGCAASDLVMSTSTDGLTWSPITRLPLDPIGSGVDHFIPGLAVNRATAGGSAQLAVTYYYYPVANCTAATCQLDVGVSTSANGGATWTSTTQAAGPMSLSWLPDTSQGTMVGDYISTSFVGGAAFPAFAVAAAPTAPATTCAGSSTACNEATFTVKGGLSAGRGNPARDQVAAGANANLGDSSVTVQ